MVEGPGHCGWCYPCTGGSDFYMKTGWAIHVETASKQHHSMTSASAPPASNLLPHLSTCPKFLWWWRVQWSLRHLNPFLPSKHFFSYGVSVQQQKSLLSRVPIRKRGDSCDRSDHVVLWTIVEGLWNCRLEKPLREKHPGNLQDQNVEISSVNGGLAFEVSEGSFAILSWQCLVLVSWSWCTSCV